MSAGSRRLLLCFLAVASVAVAGCNSPTLPLPPPAPPALHSVMLINGQVVIQGHENAVEPQAFVWCINKTNKAAADMVADSHGAFTLSLPAQTGNTVDCWQQVDHLVSDPASVVVPSASQ